jgi:TRAP-type uncharacterized transport system substrate-binding protein
MFKKLSVLTATTLLSTSLMADTPVIATGAESGNYYKYGVKLNSFVKGNVIATEGSKMNFQMLAKGEADIAIAQKDSYKWFTDNSTSSNIEYIGDLKKECVYVVVNANGNIKDDDDLQKKDVKIAAGGLNSGSLITWSYMKTLEKGFNKASTFPEGGTLALNKVLGGTYDAMLFVQTPTTDSKLVKLVNKSDNLKFIDVTDWDLNDKLDDGSAVYTFEEVTIEKGFFGTTIDTICTTASVFVNSNLDPLLKESISDAILSSKNYILGEK